VHFSILLFSDIKQHHQICINIAFVISEGLLENGTSAVLKVYFRKNRFSILDWMFYCTFKVHLND